MMPLGVDRTGLAIFSLGLCLALLSTVLLLSNNESQNTGDSWQAPQDAFRAKWDASVYPPAGQIAPALPEWMALYTSSPVKTSGQMYVSCPSPNQWGLTFDDGPSIYTPTLLDALKSQQLKATFFVIGTAIMQSQTHRDILLRAHNEGHQIGIHTWAHRLLPDLTDEEIIGEVLWTGRIIYDLIGVFPTYMRPPRGALTERVITILTTLNMTIINWNIDTNDWKIAGGGQTVAGAYASLQAGLSLLPISGVISLEHDVSPEPVAIASSFLSNLTRWKHQEPKSYFVGSVAQCLNGVAPYAKSVSKDGTVWPWVDGARPSSVKTSPSATSTIVTKTSVTSSSSTITTTTTTTTSTSTTRSTAITSTTESSNATTLISVTDTQGKNTLTLSTLTATTMPRKEFKSDAMRHVTMRYYCIIFYSMSLFLIFL